MKRYLPIGLDVGTSSVKMVQLAIDGRKTTVAACARAILPTTAGLTAEAREVALADRVHDALKARSFRGNDCISALQADEVHVRNIRVPAARAGDIENAVRAEAASKFSFDTGQATLRHLVAGEVRHGEDVSLEVILFAAENTALDAHVERLHRMGLVPASLDVPHCAMFRTFERYLRRKEDEGTVNVYVDIGGTTKVVITRGRDIVFIKNVKTGGRGFNEAVASRLDLSLEEASAMRRRFCDRTSETDDAENRDIRRALFDAIRPEVEQLADEINKCLRYHSVTFRGSRPGHLTFIGGEAHEASIPEMLGERLGLPVVIGQPFRGIDTADLGDHVDRRGMLSEWTVAFGLSLKGAFIEGVGLGQRLVGSRS